VVNGTDKISIRASKFTSRPGEKIPVDSGKISERESTIDESMIFWWLYIPIDKKVKRCGYRRAISNKSFVMVAEKNQF
jgi:hypothetical protein